MSHKTTYTYLRQFGALARKRSVRRAHVLSLVCWFFYSLSAVAEVQEERPNILWIVSEDNSPFLGAYGDAYATTPNLDKLATEGVLYLNAFAAAPVCAPTRFALITGMYASSAGTLHHRSTYQLPEQVKFFPQYLKQAGYYTSNNVKKDYNTKDQPQVWDESSKKATYKNRKPGQPFFSIFNFTTTHESQIQGKNRAQKLGHDPKKAPVPPYHPRTPEMEEDWALYYDRMQAMDAEAGEILRELEASGLAENTIVFYYSDHGGALARGKRFLYESGLRVPLIIRFPKKYAHLAPGKPGAKLDRIVSFVDFAPSILSLANVPLPSHLQGKPFLGKQAAAPREYAYSYKGRMDERLDLGRSVRNKKYRYIRNYLPHRIPGQHVDYQWQASSMVSWENAYKAGQLNEAQSFFWKPKPAEELYDVEADPHNIHNLAGKKEYESVLREMRQANQKWLLETKDAGFIPEAMLAEINQKMPIYDYLRTGSFPLERVLETADMASSREAKHVKELTKRLQDKEPVVRYWSAIGCVVLGKEAASAKAALQKLLQDPLAIVQVAAAEALYGLGETTRVLPVLRQHLQSQNRFVQIAALEVLEKMGKDAQPLAQEVKALSAKDEETSGDVAKVARYLSRQLVQR
ncbi:sulfatase-like hydrolase/transferase [Rufibacter quisquiliarum]|uniref:Arylsulfatase A-like enzyme n=1 Tax=Rufibacter quisquiliarum TaxID=1549639 RepID=A0A839GPS9_9BACT|nr:sulfatase-like hydrolase/transferase [Rufibacter quisquiliarum]MBA9075841.1 arylsulfatase A-like enzyme [Rufibacter quisquiliarum]